TQQRVSAPRVRETDRDVAGTAWRDATRNLPARCALENHEHFEHGIAASHAKVERRDTARAGQMIERGNVTLRKIDHMNIVSHTRAVVSRIIISKHVDVRPPTTRDTRHHGSKIVRRTAWRFTDLPRWVRTCRIEVAQEREPPLGIAGGDVLQDHLHDA